ncbi:MAG: hypothetical protein FGM57_01210 [Candidatus Taylorbacteria bacterium]|nr:hypothetical protein [Candidatus Taylorbacteria bacterium]
MHEGIHNDDPSFETKESSTDGTTIDSERSVTIDTPTLAKNDRTKIAEIRDALAENSSEDDQIIPKHSTIPSAENTNVRPTKKEGVLQTLRSFFKELMKGEKMKTNIIYQPDRLYRTIGKLGYEEFLTNGTIESKNKRKYADVSFNVGEPANLYLRKDPSYILEATAEAANFKPKINIYDPTHRELTELPYRGCEPGEITKDSPIRIFELTNEPGVYKVVFDNIHDPALEDTAV